MLLFRSSPRYKVVYCQVCQKSWRRYCWDHSTDNNRLLLTPSSSWRVQSSPFDQSLLAGQRARQSYQYLTFLQRGTPRALDQVDSWVNRLTWPYSIDLWNKWRKRVTIEGWVWLILRTCKGTTSHLIRAFAPRHHSLFQRSEERPERGPNKSLIS